jgi:hypothetical protein
VKNKTKQKVGLKLQHLLDEVSIFLLRSLN